MHMVMVFLGFLNNSNFFNNIKIYKILCLMVINSHDVLSSIPSKRTREEIVFEKEEK